ncbi:MAG: elongation factor 1-beta [Thermoplasmataceae archaeon]
MGEVIVTLKVLPEDSDINIDTMKSAVASGLEKMCKVVKIEMQEIAFGLKGLKIEIIIPDADGEIDKIESGLSSVEGVGQVDTEDMSLL